MTRKSPQLLIILGICSTLMGCSKNEDLLIASAPEITPPTINEWRVYGGTSLEQRYSPLNQINKNTVPRLSPVWHHQFDDARGLEATPLVIDGVLYTTGTWSKVYAFDARTGELKWQYDPKVAGSTAFKACCDVVNRGVAYHEGRIFIGTLDGRLEALNAESGELEWSTLTVDPSVPYTITGAPRVINEQVIIGNGGAENGVRGYVSAYSASSGELLWRFYTVPTVAEKGFDGAISDSVLTMMRETWQGNFDFLGGGGTVWDAIVHDQALEQIIIGVGNGSPWDHKLRSEGVGDNLFVSSIVALDDKTGEYRWHYQGTPGDTWDFTQTQPIILADLTIDGEPRQVLMQVPKNGFFYVIDRKDGSLISAKGIVPQTWTSGVDMTTGRPIETEGARYEDKPFVGSPGGIGAHNWHPMAFSQNTGLVYIPAQIAAFVYKSFSGFKANEGAPNWGVDYLANALPSEEEAVLKQISETLRGVLLAWDPLTQKEVWRAEHEGPWNGGILATAGGLVFQGIATGEFHAYDDQTGKRLWTFDTDIGIMAPPISYQLDGVQYIGLMAGYGGGYGVSTPLAVDPHPRPNGRLIVFALNGTDEYSVERKEFGPFVAVIGEWQEDTLAVGREIYERGCSLCHGPSGRSSGVMPDLRRSAVLQNKEAWQSIVYDGALESRGMIGFSKWYSREEVEAVRGYVAGLANRALAREPVAD